MREIEMISKQIYVFRVARRARKIEERLPTPNFDRFLDPTNEERVKEARERNLRRARVIS